MLQVAEGTGTNHAAVPLSLTSVSQVHVSSPTQTARQLACPHALPAPNMSSGLL